MRLRRFMANDLYHPRRISKSSTGKWPLAVQPREASTVQDRDAEEVVIRFRGQTAFPFPDNDVCIQSF